MQKFSSWLDSFPKIKPKNKQRASLRQENNTKKQTGASTSRSFLRRTFRRCESAKKSESFRISEWRTGENSPKVSNQWKPDSPTTESRRSLNRFEAISCEYQEMQASMQMVTPGNGCYTLPLPPNRPHIRTNPWYGLSPVPSTQKSSIPCSLDLWKDDETALAEGTCQISSMNSLPLPKKCRTTDESPRPTILLQPPSKFLDESMCSTSSSGYGSQDSSPESSVHTPDWQRLSEQYDKLVAICDDMVTSVSVRSSDKGIFYKLRNGFAWKLAPVVRAREEVSDGRAMATEREALRSHSPAIRNFLPGSYERSELSSEEDFESDLEADMSECDYCILKTSCKIDKNGNPLPGSGGSCCAPKFHAPPPPPLSSLKRSETFLQNLNWKMGTLKEKNKNLKATIKRAKEEREKKLKEKQICFEKIQFLHDLKWVIQGNFEIAL